MRTNNLTVDNFLRTAEDVEHFFRNLGFRPNLEVFIMKLNVLMRNEMQRMQNEQQSNQLAMQLIGQVDSGRIKKEEVIDA